MEREESPADARAFFIYKFREMKVGPAFFFLPLFCMVRGTVFFLRSLENFADCIISALKSTSIRNRTDSHHPLTVLTAAETFCRINR